jgi:glycogen phosphorylase
MEMALDPAMPTYAGGLGVLAGDTLRAAADWRCCA